jgi:hypothetical protein
MEVVDARERRALDEARHHADEGYRIPRSLGQRWPCASGRHDEHEDDQTDMRKAA